MQHEMNLKPEGHEVTAGRVGIAVKALREIHSGIVRQRLHLLREKAGRAVPLARDKLRRWQRSRNCIEARNSALPRGANASSLLIGRYTQLDSRPPEHHEMRQ